jgi:predicted nucleic acid-binding protein
MTPAFADTSFYVAALIANDEWLPAAVALADSLAVPVVTTEFILVEVSTFFTRPAGRGTFVRFLDALRADPHTLILPASADLFVHGVDLFRARPDQEWSLTDCISFVVMTERGITDALTADHHFEQAGFRALLR